MEQASGPGSGHLALELILPRGGVRLCSFPWIGGEARGHEPSNEPQLVPMGQRLVQAVASGGAGRNGPSHHHRKGPLLKALLGVPRRAKGSEISRSHAHEGRSGRLIPGWLPALPGQ